MHVEALKVYCDLVDTLSFSQAALRNYITQSAVSQQLKALEERFATSLLIRDNRSVAVTKAGRILYEGARELLGRWARLESELRSAGGAIAGSVRVATIYSVGLYELSHVTKKYLKDYPGVNLHLEYSRATRVYEDCLSGAVDLGIVPYPRRRRGIEIIDLPADRLTLICPPEHPLARGKSVRLSQLNGQNFVAFEKDIPSRRAIDTILRANKVRVHVVMEFDNIETIKRSVEIGAGISIVPVLTVQRELESGALRVLPFTGQEFFRPLGAIVKRKKALTPPTARFVELLQKFSPAQPGRTWAGGKT